LARLLQRFSCRVDKPSHRLIVLSDDELIARLKAVDQIRQLRLSLFDRNRGYDSFLTSHGPSFCHRGSARLAMTTDDVPLNALQGL